MRLEEFQIHDDKGRPQIVRMCEVLPTKCSSDDQSIELRAGWFSGCVPFGYLFIAIAVALVAVTGYHIAVNGFRGSHVLVLFLVLCVLALAFWMFSKRAKWTIDRDRIRRWRSTSRNSSPTEWATEDVQAVMVVEQGAFACQTYHQSFAPGIWLKTSSRPIDLGASHKAEALRTIAESIATLIDVPLHDNTRSGVFAEFRTARRRSAFIFTVIALVVGVCVWWVARK
jgi:hypothetical protein